MPDRWEYDAVLHETPTTAAHMSLFHGISKSFTQKAASGCTLSLTEFLMTAASSIWA